MSTVIEISGGEFRFCAAHTGVHADRLEPLHGHTFTAAVRVAGDLNERAMVADFARLKAALRDAIAPLARRTLVAARSGAVTVQTAEGRVRFGDGIKHYDLPACDVTLLPITNTTTEAIAGYLLGRLVAEVSQAGLAWMELTLTEAPGVAATVRWEQPA